MDTLKLIAALALTAALAACGARQAQRPAAAPTTTVEAESPILPIDKAREVVASIEANWPVADDHPLREPTSLVDVEAILKLDQVRLFPAAIELVETYTSVEGLALHGQIELAWAEAYMILVEVMANLDRLYVATAGALEEKEAAGGLSDDEQALLAELKIASSNLQHAGKAFTALVVEHLVSGSDQAKKAIAQYPNSYLGYRVMADYHRLTQEWDAFDAMIAKIQERNPDSNGMRFLKGAAAFQKARDRSAAAQFYRDALVADPEFVRAQAHLMMIQSEPEALYREYLKLKALNPDHQIVSWAAKGFEQMVEQLEAATPGS